MSLIGSHPCCSLISWVPLKWVEILHLLPQLNVHLLRGICDPFASLEFYNRGPTLGVWVEASVKEIKHLLRVPLVIACSEGFVEDPKEPGLCATLVVDPIEGLHWYLGKRKILSHDHQQGNSQWKYIRVCQPVGCKGSNLGRPIVWRAGPFLDLSNEFFSVT